MELKVTWIGRYDTTGYGTASIGCLRGLMDAGVDVVGIPMVGKFPEWGRQVDGDQTRIHVMHHTPQHVTYNKYRADAAMTYFEFLQAPEEWSPILDKMFLIMTSSEYSRQSLGTIADIDKIKVVSHGVSPRASPDGPPLLLHGKRKNLKGYKFLSVFEWSERKCPELMIKAFSEEFEEKEDACLILRTFSTVFDGQIKKRVKELAGNRNVFLMLDPVDDIFKLYRACDCYIGMGPEGFGLPLAEAMACGLMTIGQEIGGQREFMTPQNSILIGCEHARPIKTNIMYKIAPWFDWNPPKKDELRFAMRAAFEGRDTDWYKNIVSKGIEDIKQLTWKNAGEDIKQTIQQTFGRD